MRQAVSLLNYAALCKFFDVSRLDLSRWGFYLRRGLRSISLGLRSVPVGLRSGRDCNRPKKHASCSAMPFALLRSFL
jgi:hypothetical protein